MTTQSQSTLERPRVSRGSEAVTRGLRVSATPAFLAQHSDPQQRRFVFGYRIRIVNEGAGRARLLTRHWEIVDADGSRHVVDGEGVVGQQPDLAPGAAHEYESYCPLTTPWGTMEGSFTMQGENGDVFTIAVARFYLVAPVDPASHPGRRPAIRAGGERP